MNFPCYSRISNLEGNALLKLNYAISMNLDMNQVNHSLFSRTFHYFKSLEKVIDRRQQGKCKLTNFETKFARKNQTILKYLCCFVHHKR